MTSMTQQKSGTLMWKIYIHNPESGCEQLVTMLGGTMADARCMGKRYIRVWNLKGASINRIESEVLENTRGDYKNGYFQKVEVKGIVCEFTSARIDRNTVPPEKFFYEVASDDDEGWNPARVKKAILVNFYGTLISDMELPLGPDGVLWLEDGDFRYVD